VVVISKKIISSTLFHFFSGVSTPKEKKLNFSLCDALNNFIFADLLLLKVIYHKLHAIFLNPVFIEDNN
jgi:hypothetical protein